MSRLLLTTLLVVFLRLLTLAEAAAHPHFPSEPDRSEFGAAFDPAIGADAAACMRGRFEPDYFDFTAKGLRSSSGFRRLEETRPPAPPDRSDPLPQARPSPDSGISLAAALGAPLEVALARQDLVPPQLTHPPYFATAPPLSQ